ncbi:MAG: EpsG family protein [Sphingobacterium sp.]|jgi:hypothetical protein|nr:EpsG family protein [Sphingobacterium sp.]
MIYTSLEYGVPYVVVLLILFLCSILEQKKIKGFNDHKKLKDFSFLLVLIFLGLRGFVASDWISYYQFFSDVPPILDNINSYLKIAGFEIGFVVLSSLIKTVYDNYFFYQFVNVLIDLLLLRILLNRYCRSYFVFGLAVYFAFCSEIEINMLRNVKAIMLFLISIQYIKQRNGLKFYAINILGLMFHYSAIFYFPLYFFIHKDLKKLYFVITVIGLLVYFSQIKYIGAITEVIGNALGGAFKAKNDVYLTSEESGITLGVLYTIIPLFLTFKYYDRIVSYSSNNLIFVNLLFFYCFSTLFFSEILVFRGRFSALFAFSLSVILPLFYLIQKSDIHRKIFVNILLIIMVSKIALTNTPILNRYDNLIFGVSSYSERMIIIDAYYRELLY